MRGYWRAFIGVAAVLGGLLGASTPASANGCGIPFTGTTYELSLPSHFSTIYRCDPTWTYSLVADVDLTGISVATRTNFTGVFDGNGHTISNLSVSSSGAFDSGMFDIPAGGATFRDINFVGSSVIGGSGSNGWAGALVREAFGPVTITNSSFQGTVTGGSGDNSWAGAFVGEARGNLIITDSYVKGTVAGGPGLNGFAGGFVGNAMIGSRALTFRRNYMTGSVTGGPATNAWAGGFFGQFGFQAPGSIIENSFVRATVTSGPGTGAVANGFVGDATSGYFTLSKSYFEGSLTGSGSNAAQPILGSGTVTRSSVYCVTTCGSAGIGTAKASLSLLKASVAADSWDFANTWCYSYGHNDGYPVLKGQTYGPNAAWGNCVPEPAPAPPPVLETTTTSTTSTTTTTTVACQVAAVQRAVSGSVIRLQPEERHVERAGQGVKSGVSGSVEVANDVLQVRVRGITSGASVDVWLVGGRHFLGTLTADSGGFVRGRLDVPDSVKLGDNTVQMIERNCNSVGHVASFGLRLPISETLPSTGAGFSPFTWLSGLMAIATGALLKRKRVARTR